MKSSRLLAALAPLSLALGLGAPAPARAQSLEPRAYSPGPVGLNFIVIGYTNSQGDVLLDPSVPIEDVSARLNIMTGGLSRTFGLFGRQASATLVLPYVWGDVSGNVLEARQSITRSGLGDVIGRFALNLFGGPALTMKEFLARRPTTSLGMSIVMTAPTGQYSPEKLINLGTNRWAFKPELGLTVPVGNWDFDTYAGVWIFTPNDAFYPGASRRTQQPLWTFQAHVSYTFLPGLWLAADATYYTGGQSTLDGVQKDDRQSNTRVGFTASVPLSRAMALKASAAKGAAVRVGQNFTTLSVALQYRFSGWP
jgi:hypothetical protein